MATIAGTARHPDRNHSFFLTMAFVMAAVIICGFSLQLAMGRSSFSSPAIVHVHALVFFGWTFLYVLQNWLAARGSIPLHRRLGWIGAILATAMVLLGITITVLMVRRGATPFFFEPAYFLVMNTLAIVVFGALTAAAIILRRRTEWHRRLHFCAMATLTGPAFGRLLPMPLMIPWAGWGVFAATLIFPLIGMAREWRRQGSVHPAWKWGVATIVGLQLAIALIAYSPVGLAIYDAVTAGSPGAHVAPLDFPPPPAGPLITGRPD